MKIKQALILLFAGASAITAHAQTYKCDAGFKALEDKAKLKSYDDVTVQLPVVIKNCPKYDAKLYTYGEAAYIYKIEHTRAEADKKIVAKDLVGLYEAQEKNFPGTGGAVKKAMVLHDRVLATDDEVYKLLDAAFTTAPQTFTDYNTIDLYFNLYFKNYQTGTTGITQDEFIKRFCDIAAQTGIAQNAISVKRAALVAKQEKETLTAEEKQYLSDTKTTEKTLDAVAQNMTRAASKYINCDKLEAYYVANYDKNKTDAGWLQAMVNVFSLNKCYKSDVLYNGALVLNQLKPGHDASMKLGYLSQKRNNQPDAIKYYEQAAELETNAVLKADLYLDIAAIYRSSNKAEAKKYVLKAAEVNPKSGKAYVFLADLYTSPSKDCNLNEFDTKALSWLAIETVKKAEVADAKYKATVASLIDTYTKRLPTKKEAKAAKRQKGDVITYGCWINESVTLPKLK